MKYYTYIWMSLLVGALSFACNDDWDDYYSRQEVALTGVESELTDLNVQSYLEASKEYSEMADILKSSGVIEQMNSKSLTYTMFISNNDAIDANQIADKNLYAKSCVCGLSISPTQLTEGFQILMWSGKYLRVRKVGDDVYVSGAAASDGVKIGKVIKTANGYIYVLENVLAPYVSLYEYIQSLGDEYSIFKNLILRYNEEVFDRANSTPLSVDASGNTVYDSVFIVQNTFMDRYNSGGTETWSMRNEYYNSTVFVMDNETIQKTLKNAYDLVRTSLVRAPQATDTLKFEEWLVKAAFYPHIYTAEDLAEEAEDLTSVSGYMKGGASSVAGIKWRNSVQKVEVNNPTLLSNGIAYKVTSCRIPNNVIIWRFKQRFYDYDNCTPEQQEAWFKWENIDPETITVKDENNNNAFNPTGGAWPGIWYRVLEANPTQDAKDQNLKCALTYTACGADENNVVHKVQVPAGEYSLRMGFHGSCKHLLNIYVNDKLIKSRVTPKSAHFDRSGAGYPEGYDPKLYTAIDSKAGNYDRDGMVIGDVTIEGEGLQDVVIRLESEDLGKTDDKFRFYCWTLRPTENNY